MEKTINTNIKDFSKEVDIIQTILIFLIAFLVPTFLGKLIQVIFGTTSVIANNSQYIIGSIVNASLITASINLKGWSKILGICTMPSLSTIVSGYVFGSNSTIYMLLMMPFIWIGNFILIYTFKKLMLNKNKNYLLTSIVAIILKVIVISISFMLIKGIVNIPEKLLNNLQIAMSINQLITASIGSILGYGIYKLESRE